MISKSLSDAELLRIVDEDAQSSCYGCDQEWYATEWQRLSGCGPTVVCNMLWYLSHTRSAFGLKRHHGSRKGFLAFMEEVWEYVTPTEHGIPTTRMLYEAVLAYATAQRLVIEYRVCDVPEEKSGRPAWPEVVDYLKEGLSQDAPIAFLNLCNGDEKDLDPWHWVTIISMDYDEDGKRAFVSVLDGGLIKKTNLALWYQTTTLGGGFVYFTSPPFH